MKVIDIYCSKDIINYKRGPLAINQEDAFVIAKTGTQRCREMTIGWKLLVKWADGSTNWLPLKDVKNLYPVQLVEYTVANRIIEEPAFACWAPYVLKKRNCIISNIKSRYWSSSHKYGFTIPKTVEEAKRIDSENGDTRWWDAIVKEMKNVRPVFKVFEGQENQIPIGYQKIRCHLIFDIKLGENFRSKARFVPIWQTL
jgi:hypothetical protein